MYISVPDPISPEGSSAIRINQIGMVHIPWQVRLGILLICCSILVYLTKLTVIDNLSGTVEYIFNSLGFLFINVLLVTLVINELLSRRARNARLEKLNMVIGIFFTEVGNDLLKRIIHADPDGHSFGPSFILHGLDRPDEPAMKKAVSGHRFVVDYTRINFMEIQDFLQQKRNFLLRLIENPVMLEHQSFTTLLQAVFHLTAELCHREDPSCLPQSDQIHLAGDISRVYRALTYEWIFYMGYLHRNYPYLFSLAVRTNPFDPSARIEVV